MHLKRIRTSTFFFKNVCLCKLRHYLNIFLSYWLIKVLIKEDDIIEICDGIKNIHCINVLINKQYEGT